MTADSLFASGQSRGTRFRFVATLLFLFLSGCALTLGRGSPRVAKTYGLAISSDGHQFLYDGRPFLWLGDTSWQFMTDWSDPDAVTYLKDRHAKGFTVVQAFLAYDWNNTNCTAPARNLKGDGPWLNDDPDTPNEAYFQNVDRLVANAASYSIVLALLPVDASSCVVTAHAVNMRNAFAYGEWLGNHFRNSPNIVWVLGGDAAPTGYENVFDQLAGGLSAGDNGTHLITYHAGGINRNTFWPTSSSDFWRHSSWLSFNMIQYSELKGFCTKLRGDYSISPPKPVVYGEGAYEGSRYEPSAPPTPPLTVRNQAYWTYLSGGYYTYGNHSIMTHHPDWASHLDDPASRQMSILKNFMLANHWQTLVPDQSIFLSGAGMGAHQNVAARSMTGDRLIVYLSGPATFQIHMSKIRTSSDVAAYWFDPQTGMQTTIGSFRSKGTRRFITPRSMTDAVLVLYGSSAD